MSELQFHVEADAWLPVAELLTMFHPANSQTRNAEEMGAIKRHLIDEGFTAEMIVVNPWNRKIVSGHGRTQAAHELGHAGFLPVVYREYPSEAEHRRAMLRWNLARGHQDEAKQAAEFAALLAEFERADLAADFAMGEGEFEALLREFGEGEEPPTDPGPQVDRAEELREKWQVELGQLWQLGEHRLICGDCTDKAVVERVMGGERAEAVVTDFPYNIGKDYKVWDDSLPAKQFWGETVPSWLQRISEVLQSESHFVTSFSERGARLLIDAAEKNGFEHRHTAVWHNPQRLAGSYPGQWPFSYEPVLDFSFGGWRKLNNGNGIGHSDVWIIPSPINSTTEFYHPAQKPIELWIILLELVADRDGIVYEPFSGSGTTLIAAEQLGRRCRAVEIAPGYVAVVLQRWADMTGQTPTLAVSA